MKYRSIHSQILLAILAGTLGVWANISILDGLYIDDDFNFLFAIRSREAISYFNFFSGDGVYRPISVSVIKLLGSLSGSNPKYFHTFTLFIHFLNSLLVFAIFLKIVGDVWLSFLAALLFSTFRLHNYTLFVSSNLGEPLVALFSLGALLFFICYVELGKNRYLVATFFFQMAALLTKESAVVLSVVLLAYYLLAARTNQHNGTANLYLFSGLVISLLFGLFMIFGDKLYVSESADYVIGIEAMVNLLTILASVLTASLSPSLSMTTLPLFAVLFLCLLVFSGSTVRFALITAALFAAPYAPFGTIFHRALYIPSIGVFFAVVWIVFQTSRLLVSKRIARLVVTTLPIVAFSLSNTVLSKGDIEGYIKLSYAVDTITKNIVEIVSDENPEDLVVVLDSPSPEWVIRGAYRFMSDTNRTPITVLSESGSGVFQSYQLMPSEDFWGALENYTKIDSLQKVTLLTYIPNHAPIRCQIVRE